MSRNCDGKTNDSSTIHTTLLIVAIALVCAVAATLAWFSVSENAKLYKMRMEITSGKNLRFDLQAHDTIEEYQRTLDFEEICSYVLKEKGIDYAAAVLEPVTTEDGIHFFYEDGTPADSGKPDYYEFVLHFRSNTDTEVHLTGKDSKTAEDGTRISSDNELTPAAMRVAFQEGNNECRVFDPEMGGTSQKKDKMTVFGLYPSESMQYNNSNYVFFVPEGVDVPVLIRVWVEGTDDACTNDIKNSHFSIQLRFEGTDSEGQEFN